MNSKSRHQKENTSKITGVKLKLPIRKSTGNTAAGKGRRSSHAAIILKKTLIVRLVLASLITVFVLVMAPAGNISLIMLLAAVFLAGCDIFSDALKDILNGDVFSYSLILFLCALIAVFLGHGIESVIMLLLYRICVYLIHYTTEKTKKSALELINPEDADIISYTEDIFEDNNNLQLRLGKSLSKSASGILKICIAVAVLYAVLLPVFAHYSVKASVYRALCIMLVCVPYSITAGIPAASSVGIGLSSSKGSIFGNSAILESFSNPKVAVFNGNGLLNEEIQSILFVESKITDEDSFMNLVSHLVYDSDQQFAKSIVSARRYRYMPGLVSEFKDIDGYGVEGVIGGSKVYFGNLEFIEDKGIEPEIEESIDGDYYYLLVSGRYAGYLVLSRNYPVEVAEAIKALKDRGVDHIILLTDDRNDLRDYFSENTGFDDIKYISKEELQESLEEICNKGRYKKIYISAEDRAEHSPANIDIKLGLIPGNEDVLLIPEFIDSLAESIDVSRRMNELVKRNALFVFIIKAVLIFLAMIGFSSIWFAVFIDLCAALATILNAIRITAEPIIRVGFIKK